PFIRALGPSREVIHAIEGHHSLHVATWAGLRRNLRNQIPARGLAEQGQTFGINVKPARVSAEEAYGGPEVFELFPDTHIRGQAIIDREPRKSTLGKRLEDRRNIGYLVTGFPSAAMNDDNRRKWPAPLRNKGV